MSKGLVVKFKNIIIVLFIMLSSILSSFAQEASMDFNIELTEYIQIQTVTSAVLIANITDKTGNLYSPLSSRFKVISNSRTSISIWNNHFNNCWSFIFSFCRSRWLKEVSYGLL